MANISCCLLKMFRIGDPSRKTDQISLCQEDRSRVIGNVLAGPSSCGKTSLLFEYAFTCAEQGDNVLFIARKPLIRLPIFVNGRSRRGYQPNPEVLKRINLVYLEDYTELIGYFSKAHLDSVCDSPAGRSKHVLIDDFERYFQEKETRFTKTTKSVEISQFVKCMAHIIDALDFWSRNMHSSQKTSLLIVETITSSSKSAERLGLYKHWISDIIKIQKSRNLFRVQPIHHGRNVQFMFDLSSELSLLYSIQDNAIHVKAEETFLINE